MSSPRGTGGSVREGTRVVLKEITATLHNSTQNHLLGRKSSGNDSPVSKTAEHEVKVRFAREFADVESVTHSESLSSAGSFHSLSSTLSTKSSSGICPDSDNVADTSYVNTNIPGVDELVKAYADIHLDSERSFDNTIDSSQDLSQDQTFASATDVSPFHESDCSFNEDLRPDNTTGNETLVIEKNSQLQDTTYVALNQTHTFEPSNNTIPIYDTQLVTETENHVEESFKKSILLQKSDNIANELQTCITVTSNTIEDSLPTNIVDDNRLNATTTILPNPVSCVSTVNEEQAIENDSKIEIPFPENLKLCPNEVQKDPSLSSISLENTDSKAEKNNVHDLSEPAKDSSSTEVSSFNDVDEKLSVSETINNSITQAENSEIIKQKDIIVLDNKENITQLLNKTNIETKTLEDQKSLQSVDAQDLEVKSSAILNETQIYLPKECNETLIIEEQHTSIEEQNPSETVIIIKENIAESAVSETTKRDTSIDETLDRTLTLEEVDLDSVTVPEEYSEFKPERQSTTLPLIKEQPDFEEFKSTAEKVTNDLLNSPELTEEDQFVCATSEIFQDPSTFDFLLARSNSGLTYNRLRAESLYVKFDPLVSNTSMLPQGNAQPINEEQNGKNESSLPNVDTPKRNPAIAAIDRLLFYSPLPSGTVQKLEEAQEKNEQPVGEPKSDAPLIADINMVEELEIVRATVLQLEEKLEKQKKESETELERQKATFQEKISKIQTQMAQEVKTKTQMTVVVEEYEKSISRLLTEREKDRTSFDQEKAKLQEELQAANHHLTNTEAAFNDVHQKYERLKGVVSVYKNNEAVLKESIQENVDTIKTLETRYDQLKDHAMAQLEKANLELDGIRKQNEAETVKLHAMIRKAELKSNSLAELVEQKTKENKELAKILDEVIARVGHGNPE